MFSKKDVITLKIQNQYKGFYELDKITLRHKLFSVWGDPKVSQIYTEPLEREVFYAREAVGVLLVDLVKRKVALVEQFRVGPYAQGEEDPWLVELVAGYVEEGESALDVAMREAKEEADCDIQHLELINEYYSSPGSSTQKFSLFCGFCDLSNASGIFGLKEESEDILLHVLSFDDCFKMLDDHIISNAHTLIGIQWLKLKYQSEEKKEEKE